MGHIAHHAIVVTSWNEKDANEAHAKAVELKCNPSPIMVSDVNSYRSFLIPSDGSKSGWPDSSDGDERRRLFKEWTKTKRHDDGSSPLEWCEVMYGADDKNVTVTDSEWGDA